MTSQQINSPSMVHSPISSPPLINSPAHGTGSLTSLTPTSTQPNELIQNQIGSSGTSQVSVGFPDLGSVNPVTIQTNQTNNQFMDKSNLCDTCCIILYCSIHERYLLSPIPNRGLFFPLVTIRSCDSWDDTVSRMISTILAGQQQQGCQTMVRTTKPQLIDLYMLQTPKSMPSHYTRVTYISLIIHETNNSSQCCCCESTNTNNNNNNSNNSYLQWLTLDEILSRDNLWGPEPYTIIVNWLKKYKMKTDKVDSTLWGVEVSEVDCNDSIRLLANDRSPEQELLLSARYSEEEIHKIFNEFTSLCFPSQFMSFISFRVLMLKLGWLAEEETLLRCIFISFSISGTSTNETRSIQYLTFENLLIGLSTMDESADHRGGCLRLRLKYLFHFYDLDHDGRLNSKELPKMAFDIVSKRVTCPRSSQDGSRSNDGLQREMSQPKSREDQICEESFALVTEMFRRIANISPADENSFISLEQFLNCIDSFHGTWLTEITEPIFRSNICAAEMSNIRFNYRQPLEKLSLLKAQISLVKYEEPCECCRQTRFHLSAHGIRVDIFGRIQGTIKFDLCSAYRDTAFRQELTISEPIFNCGMEFVRYVSTIAVGSCPRPEKANLRELLQLTKDAVSGEPLIMRPTSPCYVIPEIHSNLKTLYPLVVNIARWLPFVNPANLVFLGNFIEPNNQFALDTVLYLFCLKAHSPKRVILLRGSMECRSMFHKTRFQRDCLEHYDETCWNLICDIFDLLPLVAVVDERIFLSSTGIPQLNRPLEQMVELNPTTKVPINRINTSFLNALLKGQPRFKRINNTFEQTKPSQTDVSKQMGDNSKLKVSTDSSSSPSKTKSKSQKKQIVKKKVKRIVKRTTTPETGNGSARTSSSSTRGKSNSKESLLPPGKSRSSLANVNGSFGVSQLERFLHLNQYSHVIRSEMLPQVGDCKPFRITNHGTLITLGGIGAQSGQCCSTIVNKVNGTIAFLNRFKIRLIRLETILGT